MITQYVKQGIQHKEVAKLVSEKTGKDISYERIRGFVDYYKVYPDNRRKKHKWTEEEKEYLKSIANETSQKEIKKMMSEKFNYEFTLCQIQRAMHRFNITNNVNGKFKKGHTPYNKGKKIMRFGLEIGSERKEKSGYIEVKVDRNKWKAKQRVMYEKYHNVKLKSTDKILFADGNKTNFDKDNLIRITAAEQAIMNRNGLVYDNAELTKIGLSIARMKLKISEVEKK